MAWTSPRTWVVAELVTAALLNTHLRDNMLETSPAKLTVAGDIPYASAANSLTRLAKGAAYSSLRMNSNASAPEYAVPHQIAYKGSNSNNNGSTTLANATGLAFAVGASEVWEFEFFVFHQSDATGKLKLAITCPSSPTYFAWRALRTDAAGAWTDTLVAASGTSADYQGDGNLHWSHIVGIILNGANAGNVQVQFAQNAGSGTLALVGQSSWYNAYKVA